VARREVGGHSRILAQSTGLARERLAGIDTVRRMPGTADDLYWSVDVPGLTEREAKQLVEWVKAKQFGWFGSASVVDPTTLLTLHLDRDSAQMLYDGLMSKRENATPEHGLAASIRDWLEGSSDTH
jgi:hypothetical protein